MALVTERDHTPTTSESLQRRPPRCHECKERKDGLFTLDGNGRPICAECAVAFGRPIP